MRKELRTVKDRWNAKCVLCYGFPSIVRDFRMKTPHDHKAERIAELLRENNLASPEERIKRRNVRIARLRERSGLSLDDLAKEMGFKGPSSIQRYLSPTYDKGFRPELAARFKAALVGRGDPPINSTELGVFDSWAETPDGQTLDLSLMMAENYIAGGGVTEYRQKLQELGLPAQTDDIATALSSLRRLKALGGEDPFVRAAGLPLLEGHVLIRMPKHLSTESAEALRDWLDHLVNLATQVRPTNAD
jgi:transcriptional regulator with XRE-family HTH domain